MLLSLETLALIPIWRPVNDFWRTIEDLLMDFFVNSVYITKINTSIPTFVKSLTFLT